MIIADTVHDWPQTQLHAGRTVGYLDRMAKAHGVTVDQNKEASRVFTNVGQAQMNTHHYQEAVDQIERAIQLARNSGAKSGALAQALSLLANARRQSGDLDGALAAITEARSLSEKAEFLNETLRASALYAILWRQGVVLGEDESVSLNRPADAVEPLQKAFDLVDQMASRDPNEVSFRDALARLDCNSATFFVIPIPRTPWRSTIIHCFACAKLRTVPSRAGRRHACSPTPPILCEVCTVFPTPSSESMRRLKSCAL